MDFVPHLLYMFDFVVDDMVIVRPNHCAPDDYPTCVELTFRSSVFVSICDREYGNYVKPGQPQCGKCCVFPLESPVTDEDRLHIHVYKKRSERCKFLIGLSEMKVKPLFDKINSNFDKANLEWLSTRQENFKGLPTLNGPDQDRLDKNECFDDGPQSLELLCPSHIMAKRMLPLFNLCQQQTGNMVLVLRLLCHGPTVVSVFTQVGNKYVPAEHLADKNPCCMNGADDDKLRPSKGYRYFASNADKMCPYDVCEDDLDRICSTMPCKCRCPRKKKQRSQKNKMKSKKNSCRKP